ncbi:hypothetical protein BGW37DRAFT_173955 [Umbelopsis sp. PMI_123]|nr:hypothetical protein BGW37DRAFT_173955 [Umbelopsis sp. PMI_123]
MAQVQAPTQAKDGWRTFSTEKENYNPSTVEWPEKIEGPTVWDGKYLEAHPDEWVYQLNDAEIEEIDAAIKHFFTLDKELIQIDKASFPLPEFGKVLQRHKDILLQGRGFTLIRGFPILNYSRKEQAATFMGIGSHLGYRKTQNAKGHVLGHVKDITIGSQTKSVYDADDPTTRIYATRKAQPFHVDGTDIVGLLCLQVSQEGGQSSVISSHTVYNRLKEERPDIIELFKQSWHWDKKGEHGPNDLPYLLAPPMTYYERKLFTFYGPHFWETVPRLGIPVAEAKFEAMKYVQNLCEKEALDMWLEVGDMQFVHNHQILHARSAYRDSPELTRHLLRLWLVVPAEEGGWEMPFAKREGVYYYGVNHRVPLEAE